VCLGHTPTSAARTATSNSSQQPATSNRAAFCFPTIPERRAATATAAAEGDRECEGVKGSCRGRLLLHRAMARNLGIDPT